MRLNEYERSQCFQRGIKLFQRSQFEAALEEFREALASEDILEMKNGDPLYISYYGIALARTRKRFDIAIKLGKLAIKTGEQYPETFINLAQTYEFAGQITQAIESARLGIRKHPQNIQLLEILQTLSPRGKEIIPFLDRDNTLNKYAGKIVRKGMKFLRRRNNA
jgi:tetratricopeptide (TPR) repeat protein